MRKDKIRIMAVAGSSGGHIYPALAFLSALDKQGQCRGSMLVVPAKHAPIDTGGRRIRIGYISISSFAGGPFAFVRSAFNFFCGTLESFWFLATYRPSLVVAFGSLNTVPMVLLARIFGIKTMLHEQNVLFGRANRFLAPVAARVAVSFAESKKFLKIDQRKIALTGDPLREQIFRVAKKEALDFFGLEAARPVILVTGGSQGSASVNRAFQQACGRLAQRFDFQVIHLCGGTAGSELEAGYRWSKVVAKVLVFLKEMRYAYCAADLVVSRAGALALSEIAYFGLSAVIIPYPFAQGHQVSNARVFEACGRSVVVSEAQLATGRLEQALARMLADPGKLVPDPSAYAGHFFPDAAQRLADEATNLLKRGRSPRCQAIDL